MKGLKGNGGYTIIETMFFLVVSVALFASVVGVYAAQNRRTQFTQSVQTFDQKIRDVLNDVGTGFYPTLDNIRCEVSGSESSANVQITPEPNVAQGTNQDCVFAGKAIQFYPPSRGDYDIYTLAGSREATTAEDASLEPVINVRDSGSLSAGLEITDIRTVGGSYRGLAVLSSFGDDVSGEGSSRGNRTMLGVLENTVQSDRLVEFDTSDTSQGVLICVQEPGGGRQATILVGRSAETGTIVNIDGECTF